MNKVNIAAVIGALSIVMGAFGAHALKGRLTIDQLTSYKTGVLYMIVHAVVLLILSLYTARNHNKVLDLSFNLLLAGILLFSGSIFLLSTKGITGIGLPILGPITPIGGVLFILGWLNLARYKPTTES